MESFRTMPKRTPRERPEKKIIVQETLRYEVKHFVRQWRKHRGLTQGQLAEKTNYSDGAVSHLETGQTHYSQTMLEAIAKALDCNPADLILHEPNGASERRKGRMLIDRLNASNLGRAIALLEVMVDQQEHEK